MRPCTLTFGLTAQEKNHFKKFHWRYIIIDEAHRIKNENSILSRVRHAPLLGLARVPDASRAPTHRHCRIADTYMSYIHPALEPVHHGSQRRLLKL